MKIKQYIFLLLCSFLVIFLGGTCTPKKNEEEKKTEQNRDVEEIKVRIKEDEKTEIEEIKKDTQKAFEMEKIEEREFKSSYTIGSQKYLSLLPQIPGSPILPEDFRIGKLFNKMDTSGDAVLIEKTISNFLGSLIKKTIMQSLLYQEVKSGDDESDTSGSELYRLLTFHIENKNIPQKYRIGEITIEQENKAYALVRLFGEKGVTNGEIYLIKEQKRWYISDIQINFFDLEIPEEDDGEPFLPTTYHWIFQGM